MWFLRKIIVHLISKRVLELSSLCDFLRILWCRNLVGNSVNVWNITKINVPFKCTGSGVRGCSDLPSSSFIKSNLCHTFYQLSAEPDYTFVCLVVLCLSRSLNSDYEKNILGWVGLFYYCSASLFVLLFNLVHISIPVLHMKCNTTYEMLLKMKVLGAPGGSVG